MTNRPAAIQSLAVLATMLAVLLASGPRPCAATDQLSPGTGSRKVKQQAVNSIPHNQLTREMRSKLASVMDNPSIYRRLPITSIDVDPDMFLFLVRYPEVIVNIWQIMGVTQMSVDRTGPFQLKSDDGVGAVSDVELVYGNKNKNIYYAEGTYSGPLLRKKLKGRVVMILQTNYKRRSDGKPAATNSLDVFVKVENATASLIAKTLNPIVGPTADHNFVESLNFVQRLNETTEQNGVGVQRMAYRLKNIDDEIREKFIEVAGTVYKRSLQKTNSPNAIRSAYSLSSPGTSGYLPASGPSSAARNIRRTGYRDNSYGLSK